MLAALSLASFAAFGMELNLSLASNELGALGLTFEDLTPGEAQRVEVPCAEGRTCRVAVTLAEEGVDLWQVSVTLEEGRPVRRGQARFTLVAEPTFVVPTATDAELFQGAQRPIVVGDDLVWLEEGLRLAVRVEEATPTER
jgi:hypothetical protein